MHKDIIPLFAGCLNAKFLTCLRKIVIQNFLDVVIASCIRVFHTDDLHMVRLTDLIFLSVPLPYHFILKMLLAVEFDRKTGSSLFPLFS